MKENNKAGIKNWPEDDRPREKLFKNGEHTLSNTELIAILLGTGTAGKSAIDLARQVLQKFKTFRHMSHTDPMDWKEFKGLGKAKIAQLKTAIEIGRRFREEEIKEDSVQVKSSADAANILMPRMRDLKKEVFKAVLLNSKNKIIDIVEITEGTVNKANPAIREIFQKAMQNFCSSMVCAHNHPSGDCKPSAEDESFTELLVKSGEILQITVLDHLIIGNNNYFSFADRNLL